MNHIRRFIVFVGILCHAVVVGAVAVYSNWHMASVLLSSALSVLGILLLYTSGANSPASARGDSHG